MAKTHKPKVTLWDQNGDENAERSRATMWDVPRFAEAHRYQIVIVENVVEATRWEPFDAWLSAMHAYGYDHRLVFMNSMIAHPTPQSRDRMYAVFWRKGNTPPDLDFRASAVCPEHGNVQAIQTWKSPTRHVGKYRTQYTYRCPIDGLQALPYAWPAAAAIDWSIPAQRIGDRAKPLATATMERIRAGLERYGPAAIVQASGHTFERPGYYRTWPMWHPLGTQATTVQHGLVVDTAYATRGDPADRVNPTTEPIKTQTTAFTQGVLVNVLRSQAEAAQKIRPTSEPMPTATGRAEQGLLVTLRGGSPSHHDSTVRPDTEPIGTVSAEGNHHGLLMRNYQGGAEMSQPVEAPTGTITAIDHHSLIMPFLTDYHGQGKAAPVIEPHRTVDTRDRYNLVTPEQAIEDCGFRMLEPHEIGAAMAFPDSYIVHGSKRDRVRQYGNAVTPPVMSLILERAIASLSGMQEKAS
jgi:DNA (cytosine-5)-methyltransferase 1